MFLTRFRLAGIRYLSILLLGPAALATSFVERSFPDTVQEAPIMVRGTVGRSYSDWARGNDQSKRIYTFYELTPSEVFKGELPEGAIMVRELGGSKDGNTMEVPGTAHFSRGEEVVLTLSPRNADGSYDMRGMMMGKFNIQESGGKEYLTGPGVISPEDARDSEVLHPEDEHLPQGVAVYSIEHLRKLARGEGLPAAPQHPGAAQGAAGRATVPGATSTALPASPLQPQATEGAPPSEDSSDRGSAMWLWGAAVIVGFLILRRILKRRR